MQPWSRSLALARLATCLAASLVVSPAAAAMVELSLEDLSTRADAIVVGQVVDQASAWNADRTAIHTDVTVAVEQTAAGARKSRVTFRVAGGEVDGIGMETSDDPRFAVGERVLVFLDTASAPARLVGLQQGAYRVTEGTVRRSGRTLSLTDFLGQVGAARARH